MNMARDAMWEFARAIGVLILACACGAPAAAQGSAVARDLRLAARAAGAAGVPLVLFFSEPGCPYCIRSRAEYLVPLLADPAASAMLRLMEVDIADGAAMTDFAGRVTTSAQFARAQGVRFVPTLKFYDARGFEIAPALVGLTLPDFYQSQIERRLEQAAQKLQAH